MSELASVEIERIGEVTVARIAGEVDASNATAIRRRLLEHISNEGAGLVVDLTATEYVDSAGVRILFDMGDRLHVRGMELRLVAVPDSFVADILKTVRIDERHSVHDGVASAVGALAERLPRHRSTNG